MHASSFQPLPSPELIRSSWVSLISPRHLHETLVFRFGLRRHSRTASICATFPCYARPQAVHGGSRILLDETVRLSIRIRNRAP